MLLRSHPDDDGAAPHPRFVGMRARAHTHTSKQSESRFLRDAYCFAPIARRACVCPGFDPSPFHSPTTVTTTTTTMTTTIDDDDDDVTCSRASSRESKIESRRMCSRYDAISCSSPPSRPIPQLLIRRTYRAVSRGVAGRDANVLNFQDGVIAREQSERSARTQHNGVLEIQTQRYSHHGEAAPSHVPL